MYKKLICKIFGHRWWFKNCVDSWPRSKGFALVRTWDDKYCKRCNLSLGAGSNENHRSGTSEVGRKFFTE